MNKSVNRSRVMKMKSKLHKKDNLVGFVFALPAIMGMLVFFFVPFVLSIGVSFTNGFGSRSFVGWKNYQELLKNPTFQLSAWNTARFIFVAVLTNLMISIIISLILQKKRKGYGFFRVSYIFPLVLPTASIILFFQLLFSNNGMVEAIFEKLGFPITNWLNSPNAFYVLIILYVWKNFGYNVVLFTSAFYSVPSSYYEYANLEGAGEMKKFFKITLPLTFPYLFFIIVVSIINAFKSFREAYILGGEHPHKSIYMLQHFMNNNFQNLNYIRVVTSSILVFSVIFVLVLLMLKLRNRFGDHEL